MGRSNSCFDWNWIGLRERLWHRSGQKNFNWVYRTDRKRPSSGQLSLKQVVQVDRTDDSPLFVYDGQYRNRMRFHSLQRGRSKLVRTDHLRVASHYRFDFAIERVVVVL